MNLNSFLLLEQIGFRGFNTSGAQNSDNSIYTIIFASLFALLFIIILINILRTSWRKKNYDKYLQRLYYKEGKKYGYKINELSYLKEIAAKNGVKNYHTALKNKNMLDKLLKAELTELYKQKSSGRLERKKNMLFRIKKNSYLNLPAVGMLRSTRQINKNSSIVINNANGFHQKVEIIKADRNDMTLSYQPFKEDRRLGIKKGGRLILSYLHNDMETAFQCKIVNVNTDVKDSFLVLRHSIKKIAGKRLRRDKRVRAEIACELTIYRSQKAKKGFFAFLGKKNKKQTYLVDGKTGGCTVVDVSAGGCRIKTARNIEKDRYIKIDAAKTDIHAFGRVIASGEGEIRVKFRRSDLKSINNINYMVYKEDFNRRIV